MPRRPVRNTEQKARKGWSPDAPPDRLSGRGLTTRQARSGVQTVRADLAIEIALADAQHPRGVGAVAGAHLEGARDMLALGLPQRRDLRVHGSAGRRPWERRQMRGEDLGAVADDHRGLD